MHICQVDFWPFLQLLRPGLSGAAGQHMPWDMPSSTTQHKQAGCTAAAVPVQWIATS